MLGEQVLGMVRVLILVNHHMQEPMRVGIAQAGVLVEQAQGHQQQVVKVERVLALHRLFIQPRHLLQHLKLDLHALGHFHTLHAAVLAIGDPAAHHRRTKARDIVVRFFDQPLEQLVLVPRVVDREVTRPHTKHLDIAAQDARTHRVEGRDPHPLHRHQLLDAFLHLARSLVGEGDGHNAPRVDSTLTHQMGDAARDHARLAGSRTSQDQERALLNLHGLALRVVQAIHQTRGGAPPQRALSVLGSLFIVRASGHREARSYRATPSEA